MDNLINRIRSTAKQTQDKENTPKKTIENDLKNDSKIHASESSNIDETFIIRTSQPDILNESTNKIDLNALLAKLDRINPKLTSLSKIKESEGFRIPEEFAAVVKSKEAFRDTFRLELCDRTATIFAHTNLPEISIGSIVRLQNCALWKISGNEINLVRENLIELIN